MKTKIFYLLLLCLMVLGRGEVWAQTTVGYTEAISGSRLQARALSNGGLSHLSISGPVKGSNISDHPNSQKEVYHNGTKYTSTDSWRKTIEGLYDNQYVGYTLTVEAGYCLNISSVTAKILVADDTYNWYVVIENPDGTTVKTFEEKTTTKDITAELADNVSSNASLSGLTGTVTVKLYVKQGGSTKYFSINYLQLGVSVVEDPSARLSGLDQTIKSYPYTWDFTQISNCESEFIYFNDWAGRSGSKPDAEKVYVRQTSDGSSNYYNDSDYPIGYNISALKGLRFSKGGYIAPDCNIDYIYVQGQPSITIPSVPEGSFVVLRGLRREESGTITGTNTQPLSRSSQNGPFVFKANSTNNVTLGFGDGAYNLYGIDVIADDLERFSSLPYEWRFSDASWWVTKRDWLISTYWGNNVNLDAGNIRSAWGINTSSYQSLYLCENVQIPETNGLMFKGESGRVGLNVGHYLWLNEAASVQLPLLPTGTKIIVRARAHSEASTLTPTNTTVLDAQAVSATVVDYEFVVNNGSTHVTFTNGTKSIRILDIKVEKSKLDFVYRAITPGVQTTMPYPSTPTKFTIEGTLTPHVVGSSEFTSDYFEVTSSDNDIITTAENWINANSSNNEKVSFLNLKTGTKVGTAVLTFRFKGNDTYEPASFNVSFTITKITPTFTYTSNDKGTENVEWNNKDSWGGNALTYSTDLDASKIKFTSSDEHVATVASDGTVTIQNAGTTVIRAEFAGDSHYLAAETYYTLHVTGTASGETITWTSTSNTPATPEGGISVTSGTNTITYPATVSPSGNTVKYKTSDSDVVKVNSSGTITIVHPGMATITAYTEGNGGTEGAELSYTVTVTSGDLTFNFEPTSGTMTKGYVLMPRLAISSMEISDITSLTLTVTQESESGVVSVPANLLVGDYLEMAGTRIEKIYPRITGLKPGTATVTARLESPYYNSGEAKITTFEVTVTDNKGLFRWANESKREYTLVEGEFMMMPAISGNANGNIDGLSKGTVNLARKSYVYDIKGSSRTPTYNDWDYYYGQGVPDYTLTPTAVGGGLAYIFNMKGPDTSHPALMIYGEHAGDLILRATDSQTGYSADDITIHVVSRQECIKDVESTFWDNHSFPFTWDFTKISSTDITDDEVHWKTKPFGTKESFDSGSKSDPVGGSPLNEGEHYMGMAASFDYNYTDDQDPDLLEAFAARTNDPQCIAKYITNGEGDNCKQMPQFRGIRIALGNNSAGQYHHKRDKIRIDDTRTSDPRLYLSGGPHNLYLPELPAAKTPGANYKLFIKAKGISYEAGDPGHCSFVTVDVLSAAKGTPSTTNIATRQVIDVSNKKVYDFTIPAAQAGKTLRLTFDNSVYIYWIALSTEAKSVTQKNNTTYPAASYSYNEDLNFDYTNEANNSTGTLTPYRASAISNTSVTLSSLETNVLTHANEGLILKGSASGDYYMVATARNMENNYYKSPEALEGNNYLKPTSTLEGTSISRFVGSESNPTYTNYVFSNSFTDVYDDDLTNVNSDITNADWKFARVHGSVTVNHNMAYLQISGRAGDINTSRSRAMSEAGNGEDNSSVRPILNIIFDDDTEATDITSVKNSLNTDSDAWYTLQGVRVNTPSKGGLYIRNGKKIAVK